MKFKEIIKEYFLPMKAIKMTQLILSSFLIWVGYNLNWVGLWLKNRI